MFTLRSTTVVCVAALLLCCSISHAAARPGRQLAQAYASASANADRGASVSSTSTATSDGKPTSSIVSASGSGPGTKIDCKQAAASGEQLTKECIQGGGAGSGAGSSAGAGAAASGWASAPICKKAPSTYKVSRDQQGHPWGFDDVSCALRDANGKATA